LHRVPTSAIEYLEVHERDSPLSVCVSDAAGHRLIVASGELDSATCNSLYEACVAGRSGPVTVDLGDVTFMDCRGYSGLAAARTLLEADGCSLTLSNLSGQPARLLANYFPPITQPSSGALASGDL
jgi:anti-anti-sigma factor